MEGATGREGRKRKVRGRGGFVDLCSEYNGIRNTLCDHKRALYRRANTHLMFSIHASVIVQTCVTIS